MVLILLFWSFSFKVCNTAWIMPSFGEFFYQILPGGFKMDYPVKLKGDFLHVLVVMYVCFKDPPPLDWQKTPLGTKSRKTHGLF